MPDKLVSVVIPTYNRAKLICRTLESVLAQSYPHLEILVVDDGSTDDTETIVSALADARITYLPLVHHGYPAHPRNEGLRQSHGEYVAFLDSDDLWLPNHVQRCLRALQGDLLAGGVFTDYAKLYLDNKIIPQRMAKSKYGCSTLPEMVSRFSSIGAASNVMVRRRVFDSIGYFNETKEMSGSEDWEMWVRIAASYRFIVVAETTVNLRVHGDNITLNPEHIERSIKTALDAVVCRKDLRAVLKPHIGLAYAEVNTLAAINYYAAGDMAKARNRLKQALQYRPLHLLNSRFLWTFARTLLGKKISRWLRLAKWALESRFSWQT